MSSYSHSYLPKVEEGAYTFQPHKSKKITEKTGMSLTLLQWVHEPSQDSKGVSRGIPGDVRQVFFFNPISFDVANYKHI